MKHFKVLGIDLAKNVFQLHGTDSKGKCVLTKRLTRERFIEFMRTIPSCLIGMEACGSAHYWGRTLQRMGHQVKLISPQFVKPYVRSNKNDRNDARAIAEATTRPDMKFVSIKTVDQQDTLLIHRARELAIKHRTAQSNQIRGLLAEYGIIIPKGLCQIQKLLLVLEKNEDKLTFKSLGVFKQLYGQFKLYDEQVVQYDAQLESMAKSDPLCKELMKINGVGFISASAVTATIGDAKVFKNGREVSAWLGLVPKQHSSGNKTKLCGISKRGDRYVRTLLIHGARAAVNVCHKKKDKKSLWLADKKYRCGHNKASVALANKNARTIWAMMLTGECYRKG